MGNNASADAENADFCSSDDEPSKKIVTQFVRMGGAREEEFLCEDEVEESALNRTSIHKMPYNGIWSIMIPPNKGPVPRTGQFCCYSSEYQTIFVGYGIKRSGSLLNDVWALSTVDFSWHRLKLKGDHISPRQGSTAIMMDNFIVIFGGANERTFFTNLHTIDVTTGEVLLAETGGKQPPEMRGCSLGIYKRQLFVWGGFDQEEVFYDYLFVLDFNTME
ncbi:hypothetical protein TRFO_01728 [Tritrichomonas foetus]|uniref:Kelch motif family protein n=1 Tax=Tritrichomonas foetus TaxID=1144522 RepID=A0A1J4JQ09_9EUKA|nr:hypothetical protein TRFO_01728 [Tritrichomonas foetus]|eukprot:OHT01131.1 hypothetical protein TRFO_01728 [Tritrichomonas foetus]